jgi:hypothetical protein
MKRLHTYDLNWSDMAQVRATCTELPFVIVKLVRPLNYKLLEVGDDKIFFRFNSRKNRKSVWEEVASFGHWV